MSSIRTNLARFVPGILLLYSALAFVMFVFRLALDQPAPGLVIVAPFAILFVAMIAFGFVLIAIQWFYNRRIRRFQELAAAERARHESEAEQLDEAAGEVVVAAPTAASFEYHPVFRPFFENAALAIIAIVALGELGRLWGVDVRGDGNPWTAFLNIVLASVLCWLCYRALNIFIDKRIAEEGGAPEPEELGAEGGGAGASRVATLLPIAR